MYIQIGYQECFNLSSLNTFDELIDELNDLLGENTYIVEKNGKTVDLSNEEQLADDETYKIWPKVLGGKGGFGSLLRSFGKQILISKNKEACRDLNGRRMRDVNNEKKLKDWMQKQLEKSVTPTTDQKSQSSSHEESNDYRNVPPPHKFSDTGYDEQKKQIADDMDEAVQIAAEYIQAEKMKKKKQSSTAISTHDEDAGKQITTKKRRHSDDTHEDGEVINKKAKPKEKGANGAFFLGIDLGDISSDDDDEEEESHDKNAKKKKIAKKS